VFLPELGRQLSGNCKSGLPGYEATIFNGIVARAGTPPEILARMNTKLRKVMQRQDVPSRLLEQEMVPASSDSLELNATTDRSTLAGGRHGRVLEHDKTEAACLTIR
jgi:hypothetical protein